jgi:polyisoprenoid-binding protein YceI
MAVRPRNLLIAVALIVLAGVAGGFLYFLLDGGSAPAPADVPAAGSAPLAATPDGSYAVRRGSGSYAGYRVDEEYLTVGVRTAVGRTHGVAGTVQVGGARLRTAALRADLTQLVSDKSGRDDALRTRGIETDTYPRATFALRGPVPLRGGKGALAAGTLTLHGRRAPVRLTVRAARSAGGLVVAGSAPIRFADFGIQPPSTAGIVTVRDHGVLEFRLVLARAGA